MKRGPKPLFPRPQPPIERLVAPAGMPADALPFFSRVAADLHAAGVAVSQADRIAVVELAAALAERDRADAVIATEGWTVEGSRGQPRLHPLCEQKNRADAKILKLLGVLKMYPSARDRHGALVRPQPPPASKQGLQILDT